MSVTSTSSPSASDKTVASSRPPKPAPRRTTRVLTGGAYRPRHGRRSRSGADRSSVDVEHGLAAGAALQPGVSSAREGLAMSPRARSGRPLRHERAEAGEVAGPSGAGGELSGRFGM